MRIAASGAIALGLLAAVETAETELLPEVRTQGDVRYRSGGLGSDEREAMMGRAEEFGVKLVFSRDPVGAYEANVEITIERDAETLLEAEGLGPWVFLDLPAGNYTIVATSGNEAIRNTVEVSDALNRSVLKEVHFRFSSQAGELRRRNQEE